VARIRAARKKRLRCVTPFFTGEARIGFRGKSAPANHYSAKNRTKNGLKGNFLKGDFAFTQTQKHAETREKTHLFARKSCFPAIFDVFLR